MNVNLKDAKLKDVKVCEEEVTLLFEDQSQVKYATYHDQDCCEHVYGDFSVFKYYRDELLDKFGRFRGVASIEVKRVKGDGFLLVFKDESEYRCVKVFVACYDFQNGYYSSLFKLNTRVKRPKSTSPI